ncbi:MAG: hypothetical protein JNL28_07760 [Planctomycetes bacterium]|nr:hypothetical protein [Planctomycetota bacterium]
MKDGLQRCGAAIAALYAELDWSKLGANYCEGDGSSFFDDDLRELTLETGYRIADEISSAVAGGRTGRSLYFGAAVAELVPILAEHLVLERDVVWLNLPGDELREITRAMHKVRDELGFELPMPSTHGIESCAQAGFDHLWMVSVLTDPDAFPALHDELYERSGGPLATGRGSSGAERARAEALVERFLDCASSSALVTTTDEELTLIEPAVQRRGGEWTVPESCIETAIVGDMLRFCRWSR